MAAHLWRSPQAAFSMLTNHIVDFREERRMWKSFNSVHPIRPVSTHVIHLTAVTYEIYTYKTNRNLTLGARRRMLINVF
jgi:hypothetical protein